VLAGATNEKISSSVNMRDIVFPLEKQPHDKDRRAALATFRICIQSYVRCLLVTTDY